MMVNDISASQLKDQRAEAKTRMKTYDERMNGYGHYSVLGWKKLVSNFRSPILDSLLAQGVTLASGYKSSDEAYPNSPATPDVTPYPNTQELAYPNRQAKWKAEHKEEVRSAQAALMRKRRASE